MSWLQVVVLSIVQGLTEFLPVSSSSHLAIVSRVFFAGDAGASFTAVSQLGTEAAVVGVTAVRTVSARSASVTSMVAMCGNGKLASSRGCPPKSRSAVSRLPVCSVTSHPG